MNIQGRIDSAHVPVVFDLTWSNITWRIAAIESLEMVFHRGKQSLIMPCLVLEIQLPNQLVYLPNQKAEKGIFLLPIRMKF